MLLIVVVATLGGGKVSKLTLEKCGGPLPDDASYKRLAEYSACVRINKARLKVYKKSVELKMSA